MAMSLIHIILLFLTTAVYMAVGRMVFTHTSLSPLCASPFGCFMLGVGVWFLWFLVFHGFLGASLPVVWYTFLVSTLALSVVLTRILHTSYENPLFWPKVLVGLMLTLPVFWALRSDTPMLWAELGHILKNTAHLLEFSAIPNAESAQPFGMESPLSQLGIPLMSLPIMMMANSFLPAVPAMFSVIIYILVGAELIRQCKVYVRPHNLVAFSVVGLVGVSLLNPFFINSIVFSAYPDVFIAALLLAISLPLMDENPLPTGLGLLPYGVFLALLPALTPLSLPLILFFAFAYTFLLWRDGGFASGAIRTISGLSILLFIPLFAGFGLLYMAQKLGHQIWQGDLLFEHLFNPLLLVSGFFQGFQAVAMSALAKPTIGLIVVLLLFIAGLRVINLKFGESLDVLFAQKRQILLPSFLFIFYAVLCGGTYLASLSPETTFPTQGGLHYLLHLQFLFLLPLWIWIHNAYSALVPQQKDSVSGGASFMMSLVFLAFLLVNSNTIRQQPFAPLAHTQQVANALRADNTLVEWTSRVAVLDGTATKGYYAHALAYGLRHHAYVRPVLQSFADAEGQFNVFHDALLQENFEYLWIHAPTPGIAMVLGDNLLTDTSYLFKVSKDGLFSVKSFSHAGYGFEEAAYIPRY